MDTAVNSSAAGSVARSNYELPDFEPLGSSVLVTMERPDEIAAQDDNVTIYAPETARQTPLHAVVVAVGPDVCSVSPGDRVVYEQYAGRKITLDGRDFMTMPEAKIIGRVGRDTKVKTY